MGLDEQFLFINRCCLLSDGRGKHVFVIDICQQCCSVGLELALVFASRTRFFLDKAQRLLFSICFAIDSDAMHGLHHS